MRGIKWGWLGALMVACGLGVSTASADLQPADPPISLQVGSVVSHSAGAFLPPRASLADRRDALRACLKQRSNCIGITHLDSFDSGDTFGLTPKMIQACAEKTGGKVIESFGEKLRKSRIAETDLRELLRKCHPGVV
jgi:hypothetical protein